MPKKAALPGTRKKRDHAGNAFFSKLPFTRGATQFGNGMGSAAKRALSKGTHPLTARFTAHAKGTERGATSSVTCIGGGRIIGRCGSVRLLHVRKKGVEEFLHDAGGGLLVRRRRHLQLHRGRIFAAVDDRLEAAVAPDAAARTRVIAGRGRGRRRRSVESVCGALASPRASLPSSYHKTAAWVDDDAWTWHCPASGGGTLGGEVARVVRRQAPVRDEKLAASDSGGKRFVILETARKRCTLHLPTVSM